MFGLTMKGSDAILCTPGVSALFGAAVGDWLGAGQRTLISEMARERGLGGERDGSGFDLDREMRGLFWWDGWNELVRILLRVYGVRRRALIAIH